MTSGGSNAPADFALPGVSRTQQLAALVDAMRSQLHALWPPDRLGSWGDAFRWLATSARGDGSCVVVLDEVPYLVDSDPGFAGGLQQFWDEVRRQAVPPKLLLILTGSSVATMTSLTSGSGALYGRPDDEIVVHPFDLPAAAAVLSDADPAAVVEAYAACGGYPLHLKSWDPSATAEDNLRRLVFSPGGLLLRNGQQLISDVPDRDVYRSTLHAIGTGCHKRSAIQAAIGQRPDRSLDLLQRATLVQHRRPIGAPDRAPGLWRVADPFLQGWYELCWADRELIEAGLGESVVRARHGRWQQHLGWVFEEQARAHAVRLARSGALPEEARYGEWWTTSGGQVQIDVLGIVGKRTKVVGEAKWTARPLDRRLLDDLHTKARAAPDPDPHHILVVWSRGGADDELRRAGVRSFGPTEMMGRAPTPTHDHEDSSVL